MSPDLDDDQRQLLRVMHRFVSEHPLSTDDAALDRERWRTLCEIGGPAMVLPEHAGGTGRGDAALADVVVVAEILAGALDPSPVLDSTAVAVVLARSGLDRRAELVAPIVQGDQLVAWCPAGGFTRPPDVTPAVIGHSTDEGTVELEGRVDGVENAAEADALCVDCLIDERRSVAIVPTGGPGVTMSPVRSLDIGRTFADVTFERAGVPIDRVAASPADLPGRLLQLALVVQAATLVGLMGAVQARTHQWLADRSSFGRPLASYQALKHRVADVAMRHEASCAVTDAAARAFPARHPEAACAAKAYVGGHVLDSMQDCIQMHGGIGVTWELDLHRYLRRATTEWARFGTPDEHRVTVAERLVSR